MKNKIYVLLILATLIAVNPSNAFHKNLSGVQKDEDNQMISFDSSNSSLISTILENKVTDFDITFYGSGWTFTEINNWENTGDITFNDDVIMNITHSNLNGTVYIRNNSTVGFISSSLYKIIVGDISSIYLDDVDLNMLYKYNLQSEIINAYIVKSEIGYIENNIYIKYGESEVNGLTLYNQAFGLNISIDEFSVIKDGYYFIKMDTTSNIHNFSIKGYKNIRYRFSLYQYISSSTPQSNVVIDDLIITEQTKIEGIYNLTMSNIRMSYNSPTIPVIHLFNTNGTIDNMRDEDENSVSLVTISNGNIDILNSKFKNLKIYMEGNKYNPKYTTTINNTIINGNFIWDALSILKHNNLIINGNMKQKIYAYDKNSWWEETHPGINFQGMIKTLIIDANLFNITYDFWLRDGIQLTINSSTINSIHMDNSSIIIHDSKILSTDFGINSTVKIYNSEIYDLDLSHNSSFYFYQNNFIGQFYWNNNDNSNIHFENTNFKNALILDHTNFTAINSIFNKLILYNNQPSSRFIMNITDSFIKQLQFTITESNQYNWYFYNATIELLEGNNLEYVSSLHIFMKDSEVLRVYRWDWGSVSNLITINTILSTMTWQQPLILQYYENGIKVITNFQSNIYGHEQTGVKTIQRREYNKKLKWETIDTVESDTYMDTSIIKGIYYEYRVLNHYQSDFMISQVVLESKILPAITPYSLEIKGEITYYYDFMLSIADIYFNIKVYSPINATVDEFTIQYELYENGKSLGNLINITDTLGQTSVNLKIVKGNYTIKTRVTGGQIRFWSDWIEYNFQVIEVVNSQDSTVSVSLSEEAFVPGFTMIYFLILTIPLSLKRKKKFVKHIL